MAEMLEQKVNARGIPVFVGHGRCQDVKARQFRALRAKGILSFRKCTGLLRDLSSVKGVLGAQLQVGGSCEVLVDADMDVKSINALTPPGVGWEQEEAGETL